MALTFSPNYLASSYLVFALKKKQQNTTWKKNKTKPERIPVKIQALWVCLKIRRLVPV